MLPLMEDAARLLRRTPLGVVALHWVGTAPFALGVLRYWSDITNPRTPDARCAIEALGLALLLVWMNCWRAVCAGRLRRQLAGLAETRWTGRRVWRLVTAQSFFGAMKLVMLPMALLVMFPLAQTVDFFRNTLTSGDMDAREIMTRSRRLAGVETRQSWGMLPMLAFLWLAIALNLAIVLGIMPQLVRMLTGYESAFSRSGVLFVENPLFVILVIAAAWMAFDPFVQAVYCVRAFRNESRETGEDVRAGLRALRTGAAMMLLLIVAAGSLGAAVSPGELEKSVRETMQAHDYDWRIPPTASADSKSSWIVRMADHMVAGLRAAMRATGRGLGRLLRWLFGDSLAHRQPGAPPTSALHESVYALLAVAILAAAWIAWQRRRVRRAKKATVATVAIDTVHLEAEELTPDRLPEESWLELAERSLREENLRLALRALFLANLAWLGRREFITIHKGKTNREYETELRRRARAFADARALFAGNVNAFERAWYGLHDVAAADIAEFRRRMDDMKRMAA